MPLIPPGRRVTSRLRDVEPLRPGKRRNGGKLVKKFVLIPILFVLAAIAACFAPRLFAQPPNPPQAPKVAVVNVRAVLKENRKAKALQAELEDAIKPYKSRAKALSDEIDALPKAHTNRQEYFEAMQKKKTDWDAVNAQIIKIITDKHEQKLPAVWAEVNEAIEAVAKHHGFSLVLGYGDPDDPEVQKFQGAKSSKLRATDMGCTAMVYIHGSVDITPIVIQTLIPVGERGR